MLIRSFVPPTSEACKTRCKLRRMKLLRPPESALCAIFLFLFVNGDLTHLEFCRGIDLRGKFLILRIASLGGVCRTDLN